MSEKASEAPVENQAPVKSIRKLLACPPPWSSSDSHYTQVWDPNKEVVCLQGGTGGMDEGRGQERMPSRRKHHLQQLRETLKNILVTQMSLWQVERRTIRPPAVSAEGPAVSGTSEGEALEGGGCSPRPCWLLAAACEPE